jgi:chitosanase
MLTALQKKTAQSIVNIFETGKPLGDYGNVTVLNGDTGHLTYGRSQTTLASGNLALLLHEYCDAGGMLSDSLRPFLSAFDRRDIKLDNNEKVKSLLRQTGDDPVMKMIQDKFFDRIYWEPALKSATNIGVNKPLSITVIYDSRVHGSYHLIRDMTNQQYSEVKNIDEEEWIKAYVSVRRDWLANHGNELLHKTVYRMNAFKKLIENNKWYLPLPITVRNVVITEELFSPDYESHVLASASDVNERVLFYTKPIMRGKDVKRLQKALNFPETEIDGVFGKKTDIAVREFQKIHVLKVDGKVGPVTWAALGL